MYKASQFSDFAVKIEFSFFDQFSFCYQYFFIDLKLELKFMLSMEKTAQCIRFLPGIYMNSTHICYLVFMAVYIQLCNKTSLVFFSAFFYLFVFLVRISRLYNFSYKLNF